MVDRALVQRPELAVEQYQEGLTLAPGNVTALVSGLAIGGGLAWVVAAGRGSASASAAAVKSVTVPLDRSGKVAGTIKLRVLTLGDGPASRLEPGMLAFEVQVLATGSYASTVATVPPMA